MIEYPEAKVYSKQLNDVLMGKKIVKVKANKTQHKFAWYFQNPSDYPNILEGKIIKSVTFYGGTIDIDLDDVNIILAEGVNIKYFTSDIKKPDKHQLLLEFDDSSFLACSIRMYGGLWAVLKDRFSHVDIWLQKHIIESKAFPDLLSSDFTLEYFINLLNNIEINESIKSALATKNRIPGLGNGVLQDILYEAKLNPRRKLSTLTIDDKVNLFNSIKETLKSMVKNGGRDLETDIYNNKGKFITLNTRFKNEQVCQMCHDSIIKEQYMGGSIYYCPSCQALRNEK